MGLSKDGDGCLEGSKWVSGLCQCHQKFNKVTHTTLHLRVCARFKDPVSSVNDVNFLPLSTFSRPKDKLQVLKKVQLLPLGHLLPEGQHLLQAITASLTLTPFSPKNLRVSRNLGQLLSLFTNCLGPSRLLHHWGKAVKLRYQQWSDQIQFVSSGT